MLSLITSLVILHSWTATHDMATQAVWLLNQERTIPLVLNSCLVESAKQRARFLVKHRYWAHYTPDGTTPWDFIQACGYRMAGENLARDFSTAQAMHRALMDSQSHKNNIMNVKYIQTGVGCYQNICVEYFTD